MGMKNIFTIIDMAQYKSILTGRTSMTSPLARIILFSFLFMFFIPNLVSAETKTFTKEYTYEASELDSKTTSRINAMEQVKRLLLEELGVFLTSQTEVINSHLTKDQITSITAGIVSAVVLDEKWDGHKYWLKAKLEADPVIVIQTIDVIRNDTKKTSDLETAKKRIDTLTMQLEAVKNELGSTPQEKQNKYNIIVYKIKASDMMREYYFAAYENKLSAEERIKILNEVISLDANLFEAYEARAYQYKLLNKFKEAESDYQRAISNNYNKFWAYAQLADIYLTKKDYNKLIDYEYLSVIDSEVFYTSFITVPQTIYDDMVKQYPTNYKIYLLRGYSNLRKSLGNKKITNYVISDFKKSIKLNDKQPIAYYLLAELFRDSILFNMRDDDYATATNNIIKYCTLGLLYNPAPNIAKKLLFMRATYGHRGCELTSIDYERLTEIEPGDSLNLKLIAEQKFECNQYNQAIFYYKKAIEVTAKDNYSDLVSLYGNLANTYKANKQVNLAIDAYEIAIIEIEKDIYKNKNDIANNKNDKMNSTYKYLLESSIKERTVILDKLDALKAGYIVK
jgi:tetratricopeptide (TPR) repeat protein